MNERIVITTNGTCPWSFVIQLLRNDWPSHGGDHKTFDSKPYQVITCQWKPYLIIIVIIFKIFATVVMCVVINFRGIRK